jgi:hypothetical protein
MRSGPLFRAAGNASLRVRRRCYEWLADRVGGFAGKVVLDHGSTPDTTSVDSNCHIPWLLDDGATVYTASAEHVEHLADVFPGVRVLPWPPRAHLPQRPDVVISSSVITHVGERAAQLAFVEDLLALSDRVYLTTPNRRHWLEFHTKLPLVHWLPSRQYRALLEKLGLSFWKHLNLLDRNEVQSLFDRAAQNREIRIATEWFEPRLLGQTSNLVILATQLHDNASKAGS